MPSPTTGLQVIQDALGLTNAVGVDQTLTALETSDCLRAFNDLLEMWSTQNLAVFSSATQTFNTVANQATYTIGVGGNWNTTRPVRIADTAYYTVQNITFPVAQVDQEQYDLIPYKTQPGGGTDINQYFLYVNDYPLGLVTLWPVPNAILPITLNIDRVLTQLTSAGGAISFPPGYIDAFVNNLAVKLGPKFGKKMKDFPDVVLDARTSLANIKRANKVQRVMQYDPAILGDNTGYGNWQSWP